MALECVENVYFISFIIEECRPLIQRYIKRGQLRIDNLSVSIRYFHIGEIDAAEANSSLNFKPVILYHCDLAVFFSENSKNIVSQIVGQLCP